MDCAGQLPNVVLLGMGGISKTALAAKLAQLLQSGFEYVIWLSLRNAPSPEELLAELIQFLSNQADMQQMYLLH